MGEWKGEWKGEKREGEWNGRRERGREGRMVYGRTRAEEGMDIVVYEKNYIHILCYFYINAYKIHSL